MPLEVMQEAYSQEVNSTGFWPGSKDAPNPVFYSYVYPTPESFAKQKVLPEQAYFSPEKMLYDFLATTYNAAAKSANWDREVLEKPSTAST